MQRFIRHHKFTGGLAHRGRTTFIWSILDLSDGQPDRTPAERERDAFIQLIESWSCGFGLRTLKTTWSWSGSQTIHQSISTTLKIIIARLLIGYYFAFSFLFQCIKIVLLDLYRTGSGPWGVLYWSGFVLLGSGNEYCAVVNFLTSFGLFHLDFLHRMPSPQTLRHSAAQTQTQLLLQLIKQIRFKPRLL